MMIYSDRINVRVQPWLKQQLLDLAEDPLGAHLIGSIGFSELVRLCLTIGANSLSGDSYMLRDRGFDRPVYRQVQEVLEQTAGRVLDLQFVFSPEGLAISVSSGSGSDRLDLSPWGIEATLKDIVAGHVARVLANPKPYKCLSITARDGVVHDYALERAGTWQRDHNDEPIRWILGVRIGSCSGKRVALVIPGGTEGQAIWYVYGRDDLDLVADEVVGILGEAKEIWKEALG